MANDRIETTIYVVRRIGGNKQIEVQSVDLPMDPEGYGFHGDFQIIFKGGSMVTNQIPRQSLTFRTFRMTEAEFAKKYLDKAAMEEKNN